MHLILKFHRLSTWFDKRGLTFLALVIYKISRVIFSCDIKFTVKIGDDVKFYHNALGVVIHPRSEIGAGTSIYQNVTLGGNSKEKSKNGPPIIGNNVVIGAGAVILGPVYIGDNAKIGANSVVITDVPSGCTAVGVPAKII
ncbi:serine O-acetyltransferase [Pseudoalteromonas sp. NSLLW218]|uniref:serine O-acetyltransferase n=1 Tax=Pseudoalteromonas sp. NSLLW218 TaxID=2792048 RepID=UPI0018CEDF24|nr:serine O-acetyltransferase [Pseudoalteromonas sp. NSLLW218]MBH0087497.1 serine acetyltransferase [Pseudoalteromonas sp. NSLLW218]